MRVLLLCSIDKTSGKNAINMMMPTITAPATTIYAPVTTALSPGYSSATFTSLAPGDTLENNGGNSFVLFDRPWLKLQSFAASALKLPTTPGEFADKYGAFPDMHDVKTCIANLQTIEALASEMGDPTALQVRIAFDPDYVSGTTPPAEIYAHCMWLAGQINNVACMYQCTLQTLRKLYTGTPQKNAACLRSIISAKGGMLDQAKQMKQYTNDLQTKLNDFQTRFAAAARDVQNYFNKNTNVLQDAQAYICTYQDTIRTLQAAAAGAHRLWEDHTIATATTSIGVMVLSCGLLSPVAMGMDSELGTVADHALTLYNQYMCEIAADTVDLQKKNRLALDLSSLKVSVTNIVRAINSFKDAIARIEGVWADQIHKLSNIINFDDHGLGDLSTISTKLDIEHACADWKRMAIYTERFTTNSLISYSTTTHFPNPIPSQN